MLSLADSLEKAGAMSEGESYFWQGFANYRLRQRRTAEFYWKESLNATANLTDRASLDTYARSASYLTGLYVRYLNFTSAMKIVKPALEHLDRNHFTSSSDYTNLLIFAGCCEAHYNVNDSVVSAHFERAYHLHMDHIRANPSKETYRDAVVGFINIAYGWLSEKRYAQGLVWTEHFGTLIENYKQRFDDDEAYIDKQWARYKIFSAFGLEGIGKMDEAAEAFAAYQQTRFADTLEGQLDAADYLAMSGHWKEAADKFLNLDRVFSSEQVSFSLEDIQRYLLKKYEANAMSGRKDSALAVAAQICERLDSAIIKSQWDDGEEKETIHQKEEQILQQQGRLMRARVLALIVTVIVLTLFFIIFTIIRHRSAQRLAEMRAAKERMESELRIASDIQMSMLPRAFPEVEGLDMYASMDPAREVGGDLYSFLQKEDELYFCIGDVSGKGVPASLFMAQVTRLFHGMASYGMDPAEIATRMNAELVEDNEQSMFVTMFICRLNLKLNLLEYCNAGHNPPALGNVDGQFSFLDMLPNAPIGLWPGLQYKGESIEFFKDRMLLIYTDGLNEAENPQQDQFGEQRIIDILSSMNLSKAQDIVEKLRSEVNNFRNGAEPNDDLTMLCLKYHYEPEA
jgi:serine phosphatase RsbU (regulator of sigma subunit)